MSYDHDEYDFVKSRRMGKSVTALCNVEHYYNTGSSFKVVTRDKRFLLSGGRSKNSLHVQNPKNEKIPEGVTVYVRHMPRNYTRLKKMRREKGKQKQRSKTLKED